MRFKESLLIVAISGQVSRLYVNEGDVGVHIPCRMDIDILKE